MMLDDHTHEAIAYMAYLGTVGWLGGAAGAISADGDARLLSDSKDAAHLAKVGSGGGGATRPSYLAIILRSIAPRLPARARRQHPTSGLFFFSPRALVGAMVTNI